MPAGTRSRSCTSEEQAGAPRKRQKIESEEPEHALQANHVAASQGTGERCKDLWFEEGNVVIVARGLAFKVHSGIVARHSEGFRTLLSPAALAELPKGADGCHVLRVDDAGYALKDLLDILYDGGKSKWFDHSRPTIQYADLRAVVALAVKYKVEHVIEEAKQRLSRIFPTDSIDNWCSTLHPDGDKTSVQIDDEDCLDLPRLARELGMHAALPMMLYACCTCQDFDIVANGVSYEGQTVRLSDADMARFLAGRKALADESSRVMKSFLEMAADVLPHPQACMTWPSCRLAFELLGIAAADSGFFHDPTAIDPLDGWLSGRQTQKNAKLCEFCDRAIRRIINKRRKETWRKLGTIFNVPEWPAGKSNGGDVAASSAPVASSSVVRL